MTKPRPSLKPKMRFQKQLQDGSMMMSSSQNLARCEVMNTVSLCLLTIAAKAALVLACRQSNLSLEALAGVLGWINQLSPGCSILVRLQTQTA